MLVMKFGGTSVADAPCLLRVADIVSQPEHFPCVVVVSAAGGVTDLLLSTAVRAAAGAEDEVVANVDQLRCRHTSMVRKGIEDPLIQRRTLENIERLLTELNRVYTGVALLGELSPRSLDTIASFGEKLSSTALAGVVCDRGARAQALSTEHLLITDDAYGAASPLIGPTTERLRSALDPLLAEGVIPVLTGFIGSTERGITTTLGRGGSDYSASLVGSVLDADEVWIWTDVDGVMTADPRIVPAAVPLPEVSYAEAAELSYFGAKVIHPRTVIPAVEKRIPLRVKNTFNPSFAGTVIHETVSPAQHVVKAITSIRGLSLIAVEGAGMMGVPGIAGRVFSSVAKLKVSVLMISQASSEHSICFAVQNPDADLVVECVREEFSRELQRKDINGVWARREVAIVAAVGEQMRGSPGVAGRLFSALGRANVNVIAIAQGSSELNISFVVDATDERAAVVSIHREFIG